MNSSVIRRTHVLVRVLVAACSRATAPDQDSPLPVIEHLGITIEAYDATTNKAVDITFVGGETFIPFGKLLEGVNGLKRSPELTFFTLL